MARVDARAVVAVEVFEEETQSAPVLVGEIMILRAFNRATSTGASIGLVTIAIRFR